MAYKKKLKYLFGFKDKQSFCNGSRIQHVVKEFEPLRTHALGSER